jgi:hypothetical protein
MHISRRSLIIGGAFAALGAIAPRSVAARPTITVYKDPT